jgi:hypothetical protein
MMTALLIATLLSASPPTFEARTIAGRTQVGMLAELNEKQLGLAGPTGRADLELEQLASLVQVGAPRTAELTQVWIELVDGSLVLAQQYTAAGGKARLILAGGRTIELPTAAVATVRFHPPTPALDAEWTRVLDTRPDGDLLLVRKGDALDYHKGVLLEVGETEVQFEVDGERLPVKRAKLGGLAYYHASAARLPEVICRITETSGSRWAARSVRYDGKLRWTTAAGVEVVGQPADVAKIDFASDRILYLSDAKPESSTWTPFFRLDKDLPLMGQYYALRQDRAADAASLRLGGEEYRKGLALHSRTLAVYRLPDRFSRFKAVAGIDERVHPRGSVHLVIRGDDRVLFEADITGVDPPRALDLDVRGVRRLSILVDFARELNVGDNLLLCEARVIK